MTSGRSRVDQRKGFPDAIRLQQVEEDLDENDTGHDELWQAMRAVNARVDRWGKTMVGVMVALTTSSIMLAVDILVRSQ